MPHDSRVRRYATYLRHPRKLAEKVRKKALAVQERILIKTGSGKKAELSVADIILNNSSHGELLRCDIIVRYLAVEEYYGKNDYGFFLYEKMQAARLDDERAKSAVWKFKELIRSYGKNGYDKNSRIILDRNLKLIDGSHRMALALYHGINDINVQIINIVEDIEYSIDWFISNGFDSDEVDRIITNYHTILQMVNKPFSCILWSPAKEYTDEIINDLKIYGEVVSVKKRSFSKEEYINSVRAVYAIDDIEKWKIEKKLEYMESYSPECVAVDLRFTDPEYRIKKATGGVLSKRGERVKKTIRNKYRSRIDDYFFDIIIHIGDNIYQSEYMRCVLEPGIDFKDMLGILDKYPYALAKVDVPYMPKEFPDKIPIGKDVDVLCHKDDIKKIKIEMVDLIRTYKEYDLIIKETPNGLKLRIVKGGALIFLVDIMHEVTLNNSFSKAVFDTKEKSRSFVEDALDNRVKKNGMFVLNKKYEFIYRMHAFYSNKSKNYHKEYLINHIDDYDEKMVNKYVGIDIETLLQ